MEKREFYVDFRNYEDAYVNFKNLINQGMKIDEIAYIYSRSVEQIINILVKYDDDPIVEKAIREHYSQFTITDNKALIISDTHIGNYYEYLQLFDTIFNYCSDYGIKNIIHAGDFIEGNSNIEKRKDTVDIQIQKVLNIFGQKGIPKMFYLYGNHDYNLEVWNSISLKEQLKELKNLIYIGRGNSYVQLNDNDPINICHQLSSPDSHIPKIATNLKLEGHHHRYSFFYNGVVHLPPLSLVNHNHNLGFMLLQTTGSEFILDVYKGLENNIINHLEQKVIKKYIPR